jgi:hypothetical protein
MNIDLYSVSEPSLTAINLISLRVITSLARCGDAVCSQGFREGVASEAG